MLAIEVRDLVKRYRGMAGNAVDGIASTSSTGSCSACSARTARARQPSSPSSPPCWLPRRGTCCVAGRDLATQQTGIRASIGIVFQQPSLDANLTAEENIRLHAVLYGRYPWRPLYRLMPPAYRQQVQDLAEILSITAALGRPVRSLSGGTRRKLEIVRALLHQPRVLFLDEPTTGLDPQSRRSLWSYLRQTRARYGTTIVLTTHYLEEAEAAERGLRAGPGPHPRAGTPAEIKARHASLTWRRRT